MDNKRWADANALANVATGLAIYSLIPFFFGLVDNNVGCIPWMLGGLIFVIIAVVACFVNGDVIGATANGILTGICLLGNLWHAIITLIAGANGVPANLLASLTMGDGAADLGAAIFCLSIVIIAWKGNKCLSIAVMFPTVGFSLLFLMLMGIAGPFGYAPMICFTIFGTWMIYSGIAMMYHQATGKEILPYIYHGKKSSEKAVSANV